ncbi:glucosyltransferase [Coniosporium apollinis]|uniref:Dol-P-Glc:Glc(2)Man(9)GlcNAc(2)-PP-Dol alpha-1,2-glucosyltransferase n=1 Tax=Coniosporium apollinis TaxID=61459 RepID=A0ABQ9NQ24_9PEZI|nr:glucosyltransferase [Coniosporium apollinis]
MRTAEDADRYLDYIKVVITIGIAAVKNIRKLITAVFPYVLLLVLFAGFVAWNGGVVLGDKSNHVATIHLPQMLYLWPYITFFSFPLLLPHIVAPFVALTQPREADSKSRPLLSLTPAVFLPRTWIFLTLAALAMATVHFNTIVHPFTLADNRHYVFYVFRILLRHPAIKYLATPIYVLCGWACIRALGAPPDLTVLVADAQTGNKPRPPAQQPREARTKAPSCDVSFVIVWLATCTLSLVTAPLVEPRYFILPWLIWRLHVPIAGGRSDATPPAEPRPASETQAKDRAPVRPREQPVWSVAVRLLHTLQANAVWLELAWFLVINVVTGYVFLYKGFEWPQEPGQVQRFMW